MQEVKLMEPTLLTYRLSPQVQSLIDSLCRMLAIRCIPVPPEREGLAIGALLGLLPAQPGGKPVPGAMLVMAFFDGKLLNDFLEAYRTMQIPPVPHKAMLTITNTVWTGAELYEHITREMAAVQQGGKEKQGR